MEEKRTEIQGWDLHMISPAHADIFTPEEFGDGNGKREHFPLQMFHGIRVNGH